MKTGFMSLDLIMKTLSQLPRMTVIVPFFRGESLLHPKFAEIMQELSKFDVVQLASNGDFLPNKKIRKAILDNCSFFSLSLHEFILPKETPHLRFFYEATGKLTTQVSILDKYLPEKYKKLFIHRWRNHVDRVRIYKEHSQHGFGSMGTVTNRRCSKPFEEMVVYWNGEVGLCNHDWNCGVNLGDLNTQSICEVWNGEPYKRVRMLQRKQIITCRDCSFESNKVYGEIIDGRSNRKK